MSSLVLELQRDIYNSNISTSDLLRKAFIVARKLDLSEFEEWISLELNGYPEVGSDVPGYRVTTGLVMAHNPYHGWIPFIIPDVGLATAAATRGFAQPIGEIESILDAQKDEPICIVYYSPQIVPMLMSIMTVPLTPALHVPKSKIHKIIHSVRNIILEWSLKLEKDGVLGEGMTFSSEEKHLASVNTYRIETFIGQLNNSQSQTTLIGDTTLIGEITMGDNYKAGQAGAMGPNSHAENMNFNQIWNEVQGSIDLPQLAEQLTKLRQEMRKQAVEPEDDIAISEIAKAEQAAKLGDGSKTIEYLKAGGKFALDVASKIGVGLVIEAIKAAST